MYVLKGTFFFADHLPESFFAKKNLFRNKESVIADLVLKVQTPGLSFVLSLLGNLLTWIKHVYIRSQDI